MAYLSNIPLQSPLPLPKHFSNGSRGVKHFFYVLFFEGDGLWALLFIRGKGVWIIPLKIRRSHHCMPVKSYKIQNIDTYLIFREVLFNCLIKPLFLFFNKTAPQQLSCTVIRSLVIPLRSSNNQTLHGSAIFHTHRYHFIYGSDSVHQRK